MSGPAVSRIARAAVMPAVGPRANASPISASASAAESLAARATSPGPRELVARGVALPALLERPGAAEPGVGGVGIGTERVGAEQVGVEPVRGGIVVGESCEGGQAQRCGAIGRVLEEACRPARADGTDAISLDRVDRLTHYGPWRIRSVGASGVRD